jgi:hypothetical protein
MIKFCTIFFLLAVFAQHLSAAENDQEIQTKQRITELNTYWAAVSRCVNTGDWLGYKASCHEDGVLVSGRGKKSYPLAKALINWKQEFVDTKSGKIKASVIFRFSKRLGDASTAHETGIFLYSQVNAAGKKVDEYIHFEALLVKKGIWKIMMEFQKSKATEKEWNQLKVKK